ncbi:MAG TPA: hypothetical protein VEY67_08485 [Candidatus Dormibacteraeota bacterium]|nr:hypothetical protein [Candidatus Dormibacteraeota bacterium]
MSDRGVLAIMGSGEAAPTMARVHSALLERLGPDARVAIIDTPYGFQENADELSARMAEFFQRTVGAAAVVASLRTRDLTALEASTALARVREAPYVMAGPGSPTYALRHWAGGPVPAALVDKVEGGGVVTMASAAALTLGVTTIPVYEIYKVGEEPHWVEGLDVLGRLTGLRAAVVPHYDNAEGGTHDTRFCYMGERRLAVLEAQLPPGAFVLGVDGHTALILDLGSGTASVAGLGGVTVRALGRSAVLPAGSAVPIERLASLAAELSRGDTDATIAPHLVDAQAAIAGDGRGQRTGPLRDAMIDLEGTFVEALDRDDTTAAVTAILDLDEAIAARLRAGEDTPDLDNARAMFRSLVARLGERTAASETRPVVGPFVEALLELRGRARADRDWGTADLIRDRLAAAGVEVRDGAAESSWVVQDDPSV